jgi:hypothetical protein
MVATIPFGLVVYQVRSKRDQICYGYSESCENECEEISDRW